MPKASALRKSRCESTSKTAMLVDVDMAHKGGRSQSVEAIRYRLW
jgi:hypothetical protein